MADKILERIKTGISGLDEILDGGIYEGSSICLEGPPGSGKTVLAMQLIANINQPSLFISSFHNEKSLLNYSRSFGWKLASRIKQKSLFVSDNIPEIYNSLSDLKNSSIIKFIENNKIKVVVIDSANSFFEMSGDAGRVQNDFFLFLKLLKEKDITRVLIKKENTLDNLDYIADIIVKIEAKKESIRKTMEITKNNGKIVYSGKHLMKITSSGVRVFLNTDALELKLKDVESKLLRTRVRTGIQGFDEMLQGGYFEGESSLIEGGSGTGKTLFGLSFLRDGVKRKEKCLYAGFNINKERMINTARVAMLDEYYLKEYKKGDRLDVFNITSDIFIEEILEQLDSIVKERDIKRIVLDGIDLYSKDEKDLYKILGIIRKVFTGKTSVILLDADMEISFKCKPYCGIFDNIIFLSQKYIMNSSHKIVSIIKANDKNFENISKEINISQNNIELTKMSEFANTGSLKDKGNSIIRIITYKDKLVESIINEYNKSNPDIKAEILNLPIGWFDNKNIEETLNHDENIGIFLCSDRNIQYLIKENMVISLEGHLTKNEKLEYFDTALQGCSCDGNIYGLPDDIKCELMGYRKDLSVKYGLKAPETWEEFINQAKDIVKKENNEKLKGAAWGDNIYNKFLVLLFCNGGEIYNEEGEIDITDKSFVSTLEFMYDMKYKHEILHPDYPKGYVHGFVYDRDAVFFFINSAYDFEEVISKGDMDFSCYPLGPYGKEKVSLVSSHCYSVSKKYKYEEEAVKLLKYFTSFKNQKKVELSGGGCVFPGRRNICYDPGILEKKDIYKRADVLIENIKVKYLSQIKNWDKISPVLKEAVMNSLDKKINPHQSLRNASEIIKRLDIKPVQSTIVNMTIFYLQDNLEKKLTLNNIADNVSISVYYLAKIFKKETNKTVFDYLAVLRVERAKKLLRDVRLNIGEVSVKSGFPDPNYFARTFKKIAGITPSEYRRKSV